MSRQLHDVGRATFSAKSGNHAHAATEHALGRFDAEAWSAVVEEQRLCIAIAAGVDPSKVRIHIGH